MKIEAVVTYRIDMEENESVGLQRFLEATLASAHCNADTESRQAAREFLNCLHRANPAEPPF